MIIRQRDDILDFKKEWIANKFGIYQFKNLIDKIINLNIKYIINKYETKPNRITEERQEDGRSEEPTS